MMAVNEYIKLILKKKKWTNVKLCQEINKIEEKIGDTRTSTQNITNYLNGYHNLRPRWLVKVEKALELDEGVLLSMVTPPSGKDGKKDLKNFIKQVRGD